MRSGKELIAATRPFMKEHRGRSWFHLLSGYALLLVGMAGAALAPWWPVVVASCLLAGLSMLKLFIVYHDYMHRALLKRSRVAKALMHAFGYFILAPPSIWKRTHDFHHAHNAKLAGSQVGSFPLLSTRMYERLKAEDQRAYRWARSPWIMAFGLVTVFAVGMCLKPFLGKPRENRQGAYALLVHLGLAVALVVGIGWHAYLLALVVPHAIAAAIGAYLFYAQHNFPGAQFESRHDWEYSAAALRSSSYCRMGPVMQWFSGNIGYHHVHHLNSAIPFYNLPQAMEEVPELRDPIATSLSPRDIAACLALKLWDPDTRTMVGFTELAGDTPSADPA